MSRSGGGPELEMDLPVGATGRAVRRGRGHVAGGGAHGPTGLDRQARAASRTPVLRSRCGQKPSEGVEQDRDVIRLGF